MASRTTMLPLIGTIYAEPSTLSGIRRVSAASGPYPAELSASRPKIGMPRTGPICSARSWELASGLPKIRSFNDVILSIVFLSESGDHKSGGADQERFLVRQILNTKY